MAFYANYPIALAPGMGLNAFFAFTVVLAHKYTWQQALGGVFISGVLFFLISVTGLRGWIIDAIPRNLKLAIAAGVGIGPLPWFLANDELLAGRIVRVLPDYRAAGGTAYMVYPPAKPLSPKLAKFCAHLSEHVPRLAGQP